MPSNHPESHLQLSTEEIKRVCECYELGDNEKKPYLFSSKTNVNIYIQTTTGKYVIRSIRDPITEKRVNYVQELLTYLQKNHIPVIQSLKNYEGNFLTHINNKVIQVTPFIEATTYNYDIKQLHSNAKMLRTIHDVLKTISRATSKLLYPSNKRTIRL